MDSLDIIAEDSMPCFFGFQHSRSAPVSEFNSNTQKLDSTITFYYYQVLVNCELALIILPKPGMFTACIAFRGVLDGANKSWIQKPVELRIQLLQMGEPASSICIFDAEFLMLA
jgi:hypothetical protein